MKLTTNIFLVGFSGSGKSTVGNLLARKLNCRFVDIDHLLEKQTNQTITEIFEAQGERAFRKMECSLIKKTCNSKSSPKVMALGGGAFENKTTRALVSNNGISVWLKCSQTAIYYRLNKQTDRPKLKDRTQKLSAKRLKEKISRLHAKREKNYAKANLKVITSNKTANRVTSEIIVKLKRTHAAS
jgi:shikimate kinase